MAYIFGGNIYIKGDMV